MKKIGLISDTHGYLDETVRGYLEDVDEIWHAGDIGGLEILDNLSSDKVWRTITGNIDDLEARNRFPEELWFEVEGMKIGMVHIGGKPPQYAKGVKNLIRQHGIKLFVCGHSHICKVEFDKNLNCLYMNPGAVGQSGFHVVRTMLLFEIENAKIQNLKVVELGKRGR